MNCDKNKVIWLIVELFRKQLTYVKTLITHVNLYLFEIKQYIAPTYICFVLFPDKDAAGDSSVDVSRDFRPPDKRASWRCFSR